MAFAKIVVLSQVQVTAGREPIFTYHVPDDLQGQLTVGSLVVVPFGPRRLYGIVVAFSGESPVPETRPIEALVDPDPVLNPAQIALARWIGQDDPDEARKLLEPLRTEHSAVSRAALTALGELPQQ